MNISDVKTIIKEEIIKTLLNENTIEHLSTNISSQTISGKAWNGLIESLQTVIKEIEDFPSQYSPELHGPLPNIHDGLNNFQKIINILQEIKPIIIGMTDIEKKDYITELSINDPLNNISQVKTSTAIFCIPQHDAGNNESYPGNIQPGYYTEQQLVHLLKRNLTNPDALEFIASMLETGIDEKDIFPKWLHKNKNNLPALKKAEQDWDKNV